MIANPVFVRLAALLSISLLAACAAERQAVAPAAARSAVLAVKACRVTPDGIPVVAERGIGGTGINTQVASRETVTVTQRIVTRGLPPETRADAPQSPRPVAETGIVGVITGFGSICVNGLEVGTNWTTAIEIDGEPASPHDLRAGQVVALQASGSDDALEASHVGIRHEVEGPIDAVEPVGRTMVVAGQRVLLTDATWNGKRFSVGERVQVSGLRRADGTIVAARLDAADQALIRLRGRIAVDGGAPHIGGLALQLPAGQAVAADQSVVVSGERRGDRLVVQRIAEDVAADDPARYFGPRVSRLVLQAVVGGDSRQILLNGRLRAASGPGAVSGPIAEKDAIVSLDRGADGSLTATAVQDVAHAAPVVVPPAAR